MNIYIYYWFSFSPFLDFNFNCSFCFCCVCVCVCVWKGKPLLCVLGFVPITKEGFNYFILVLASRLDYGALVSCLPFATYHNFNNGCLIEFFILILLCFLFSMKLYFIDFLIGCKLTRSLNNVLKVVLMQTMN